MGVENFCFAVHLPALSTYQEFCVVMEQTADES
jgi:hypothetical protein